MGFYEEYLKRLGKQEKPDTGGFADEVMNRLPQQAEPAAQPSEQEAQQVRLPTFGNIVEERIRSGALVPPDPPEPAFSEKWAKMPLWYRAMRYPLGVLDIAQLPGDLLRSVLYDVTAREPGEPLETLRMLSPKNLARYAPWGDTPKYVAPGRKIAEGMGVPEDRAGILGTALEVLLDPLIILDGVAAAGTRLTAKAASKVTARKLGRDVFTADEMIKAARELESIGDKESGTLMRLAARQRALGKLYSPYEWLPESSRKAVERGLRWAVGKLDEIPSPFVQEVAVGGGAVRKERLSLLEALVNPQVGKAAKLKGTPHEEAIRNIYGQADVTRIATGGESDLVPSGLDLARNYAEEIAMEVLGNARDSVNIFSKYTGLNPEAAQDTYELFSKWSTEWLDKLDAPEEFSKALALSDAPIRSTKNLERLVKSSRYKEELYDRIKIHAQQNGLDARKLFDAVQANAVRQLQSAIKVGWIVSGMPEYYKTLDRVAEITGRRPFEISSALFKKAMGYDLNKKEEALYDAFREVWPEMGGVYATVNPLTFIKNVSQGYFRRAMGINLMNPQQVKRFVEDVASGAKWYPASKLNADEFLDAATEYLNEEDINRLAGFLYAYGDGPITPRIIEEKLGIPADRIIMAANKAQISDMGGPIAEKLMRDLQRISGKRPSAGLFGRSVFRTRKVADEDVEFFLPLLKTEERGTALAVAAHRAISGQMLLRTVAENLDNAGLVFARPYDPVRMLDKYGEKLMYIPDDKLFGPLAGKYIPRYAGMTLLKAVETGDPGIYSMLLNKLRMGWLSSPNTISRNVAGGLIMMRAVGIPYNEQIKYIRQAMKDVKRVYELNDPRILGPGAEYLGMYQTGTLAREAYDSIDQHLERMLNAAMTRDKTKFQQAMESLGAIVDKAVRGGPLFGWFQYSEDVMRTATYKWVYDRLIKRGYSKEQAGKAAAAAANNVLFNYADQPPAIEWFRKTGLMLFPSFFGFNVGRTANLAIKRPASIQFSARLAQATQNLLNEDERRYAADAAQVAWWGSEMPIMLPIPGSDDRFWVITLRNIVPQLQGMEWGGQLAEPILGGIAQRLIDVWYAHNSDTGFGPYSQRFGVRVYTPGATPGTKAYETVRYLIEGYAPGYARTIKQVGDALVNTWRAPNADRLMQAMGKEYGFGPEFLARKVTGIPIYEKSTTGMLRDIGIDRWKFERRLNDLQKQMMNAARAGNMKEYERLRNMLLKLRQGRISEELFRREVP